MSEQFGMWEVMTAQKVVNMSLDISKKGLNKILIMSNSFFNKEKTEIQNKIVCKSEGWLKFSKLLCTVWDQGTDITSLYMVISTHALISRITPKRLYSVNRVHNTQTYRKAKRKKIQSKRI